VKFRFKAAPGFLGLANRHPASTLGSFWKNRHCSFTVRWLPADMTISKGVLQISHLASFWKNCLGGFTSRRFLSL
jgi:hypothetical protein